MPTTLLLPKHRWLHAGAFCLATLPLGACDEAASDVAGAQGSPSIPLSDAGAGPTGQTPSGPSTGADAGGDGSTTEPGEACPTFDGAYDAIQAVIFEGKGCTASACHGEGAIGGLDLRADVSYANLIEVASEGSTDARVKVGAPSGSYLFKKLAAALDPERYDIQGSPMPVGIDPLTQDQLDAIEMWIYQGAPREGALEDPGSGKTVADLLGACLPEAAPQTIDPLPAPPAEKGVQLELPLTSIGASSEHEICVPFAYDLSDQVPDAYKDEARNVFFVNRNWTRQDPTSHHMVVWQPIENWDPVANGGTWHCYGGDTPDAACDPNNGSRDCPGGHCGGDVFHSTFCSDEYSEVTAVANGAADADIFSLLTSGIALYGMPDRIAAAGSPNEDIQGEEGVYWEIPLKGYGWYNSHAFNLWDVDQDIYAATNYYFADETKRRMGKVTATHNETPAGTPPFTEQDHCEEYVVPQGHALAIMFGHTHKRGKRFWVTDADGTMIYENFDYDDPKYQQFTPNRVFDSPDAAQRTLKFCGTFNNGVKPDGSPDIDRVTRASRMPEPAVCTPIACVEGKVGEACTSDADCDSSAGAGDGFCDACAITNGTTTENEMFVLNMFLVEPEQAPNPLEGLFPGLF